MKEAELLAGRGYPDALDWSPRRIVWISRILAEDEAVRRKLALHDSAVAGRIAQADKSGWEKSMKSLQGEE